MLLEIAMFLGNVKPLCDDDDDDDFSLDIV